MTDPALAEKNRREFARTDKAQALRKACEKYREHCEATPKEKNKTRRIRRVQQMKNIELLLNGLEKNVFYDPRDYVRMQIAEKAASGLLGDPGAKENQSVNSKADARNRDKQIVSFYGDPRFDRFFQESVVCKNDGNAEYGFAGSRKFLLCAGGCVEKTASDQRTAAGKK